MEDPLSRTDSQPQGQNEPATDSTSPGLNKTVTFNEPQITTEAAEESKPKKLKEQTKDSVPEDLGEPVKFSKPQIIVEPPEESGPQNLNKQPQDNEPQDQPTQDHIPQDINETEEDNKSLDLNQLAQDGTTPNLKNEAKAEVDTPQEMSLDTEESPLPSSSEGQEATTEDDIPAPKASLDDSDQGLPEQATDNEPQVIKVQMETVVKEEPEQHPQEKKGAIPRIFFTAIQEKTPKTGKVEAPNLCQHRKCSHFCGHNSLAFKPMFSWTPEQLANAVLRPKPKPKTADKATQILPGRVQKLPKLQPKRVLPPKPPSADKATMISPSFEKLLKRPPLLAKKKQKKEGTSPVAMSKVWPQTKSLPSVRQSVSSHHHRKRKIICNLCITFCDNWEGPRLRRVQQTQWEESLSSCSGLYRASSVFGIIRHGRIHVSDLLLALHLLGVLVTSEEMHNILHCISVDEHRSLNFSEFLEAVNTTSPFAETECFQNTLHAFRKMKKGSVSVKELEPILQYLGITLSPETVHKALGRTKANKNGKFDISDFLLAAKGLLRIYEEKEEAFLNERTIFKRRPFQEVADLVDAEGRRRRKYCDCFDEEVPTSTSPLSLFTVPESDEDVDLGKQRSRASNVDLRKSNSAFPINMTKEEAKDGDTTEGTTSQMGLNFDLKSSSHESLVNNAKGENKDDSAMELEKSQVDPPRQNTENPVPS